MKPGNLCQPRIGTKFEDLVADKLRQLVPPAGAGAGAQCTNPESRIPNPGSRTTLFELAAIKTAKVHCDACFALFHLEPEEYERIIFDGDDFLCPDCQTESRTCGERSRTIPDPESRIPESRIPESRIPESRIPNPRTCGERSRTIPEAP